MKLFKTTLCATLISSLAACGGGGGGGDLFIPVYTSFSGKVIDGYIKNAKVCLDLNSNLKCDDGPGQEEEKYTKFSGDGGTYSFSYFGTRDVATMHIIAEATEDSIDEDDGISFKQANRSPVTLLAPAAAPQTVTVHSTAVSIAQIVAKEEGKTLTVPEAEKLAKTSIGMPDSVNLVNNDYKDASKGDAKVAEIARAMTIALADTQKTIRANDEVKTGVANNGKSIDSEVMKQSVEIVKAEMVKNISPEGKLTTTVDAIKASTAQVVTGKIQDIVKVTSAPKASVMDPIAYFKKGMYFLSIQNGVWFGDGKKPESPVRNTGPAPTLWGMKVSEDKKPIIETEEDWSIKTGDTKFTQSYKWSDNYYLVEGKGWVKSADKNNSITADANCVKIVGDVTVEEACGKVTPWAGKTVKEAGFCTLADKNTHFKACEKPDLVFPEESYSNDFSLTQLKDKYELWGPDNGPNIPFTYVQTGTKITVTATTGDHQIRLNDDVIIDFTSGLSKDGKYRVASIIDKATFTLTSSESLSTSGDALRYWGGWWLDNADVLDLKDHVVKRLSDSPFWYEDCAVLGQFIQSSTSASGYAVQWQKGLRDANQSCVKDTSADAEKYKQITPLVFETVFNTPIMRTIAADIYKKENDDYYGVEMLWSVATNSAGVKGIYNGEIRRASVKREIISGLREAVGNRPFVETINKAWGYPSLPSDAELFGVSK